MNESEKESEQERTVSEESRYDFDENLQQELDRAEFAGEGQTVVGEILGTGEWSGDNNVKLRVAIPFEADSPFTEDLELPNPNKRLETTKFGRIVSDHGYTRSQAKHIVGETVECTYTGKWSIVDPAARISNEESSESEEESSRRLILIDHSAVIVNDVSNWVFEKLHIPEKTHMERVEAIGDRAAAFLTGLVGIALTGFLYNNGGGTMGGSFTRLYFGLFTVLLVATSISAVMLSTELMNHYIYD